MNQIEILKFLINRTQGCARYFIQFQFVLMLEFLSEETMRNSIIAIKSGKSIPTQFLNTTTDVWNNVSLSLVHDVVPDCHIDYSTIDICTFFRRKTKPRTLNGKRLRSFGI